MALSPQQLAQKYPYPPLSTGNLVDTFRTGKGPGLECPQNEDLAIGWKARDSMRGDFVQVFQAMERTKRNAALTPGAQILEIAKFARKRMDDRLQVAEVAQRRLATMRDQTAARVQQTMRPANPHMAALLPELRAYLRSLPSAKRYDLVARETKGDDALTYLHAIASAPCALSGMAHGKHKELSNSLLGILDPSLLGMTEAFDREVQLLQRATKGFTEQIKDFVDFETAEELRRLSEGEA